MSGEVAAWRTDVTNRLEALQASADRIEGKLDDHGVRLATLLDGQASIEQGQTALTVGQDRIEAGVDQVLEQLQQPDPPPPTNTQFGALCGILKGSKETKVQARGRVTALFGGLAVERIYLDTSFDPALVNVGHSVIATWAFPGDLTNVADGMYDDRITASAEAWTGPGILYLGPNHEPDQDGRPYTAAQFADAAARVCAAIADAGNPLVKSTVILMSYTLTKGDAWLAYYDGYDVDVLGWDAYWRPTTQRTAEAVYGPCRDASAGRPWLIGETSMGALHNLGSLSRDTWDPIPEAEWTTFVGDGIPLLASSGCVAATWFETNLVDGDGRLAPHAGALGLWSAAVQASMA